MTAIYTSTGDLVTHKLNFKWEVAGWRLSRHFLGSTERPLTSDAFSGADCTWQIDLQFAFKEGAKDRCDSYADFLKVGLHLVDCKLRPSSVVVHGELKVVSSIGHPYVTRHLRGNMFIGAVRYTELKPSSAFPDNLKIIADLDVYTGRGALYHDTKSISITESNDHQKEMAIQSCILATDMESLIVDDSEADVTFYVGDSDVAGHRVLFAARSPYFRKLFESNKKRSRANIEIPDTTVDQWRAFQRYIYTGKLDPVNEAGAFHLYASLLKLSDQYEVECLKKLVISLLEKIIDKETVLQIMDIACDCQLDELKEKSVQFVKENLSYFKDNVLEEFLDHIQKRGELASTIVDCF